tara:strand:- start:168 stop:347 length:180 start_codon:yes stop_codon:yes gene_type:complete
MTQEEQQHQFDTELQALIDRFIDEYDLTFESLIGVLRIATAKLEGTAIFEQTKEDEDDE